METQLRGLVTWVTKRGQSLPGVTRQQALWKGRDAELGLGARGAVAWVITDATPPTPCWPVDVRGWVHSDLRPLISLQLFPCLSGPVSGGFSPPLRPPPSHGPRPGQARAPRCDALGSRAPQLRAVLPHRGLLRPREPLGPQGAAPVAGACLPPQLPPPLRPSPEAVEAQRAPLHR